MTARRITPFQLLVALFALLGLLAAAQSVATSAPSKGPKPSPRADGRVERQDPRGFRAELRDMARAEDPVPALRAIIRTAALEHAGVSRVRSGEVSHDDLYLIAAGDLNGDGREDGLEVSESGMEAVRGADGATLWTHGFQDWGFPLATGPLDGAAGDDVVTIEVVEEDLAAAYRWTIRYRGLSGQTGAVLWTRTYENLWTEAGIGSAFLYGDVDFAIPMGIADLTGDGRLDVLVGRYDIAFVESGALVSCEGAVSAVFESVSGADGQVAAAFAGVGRRAFPDAVIAPDFTGDAAADVVVASVTATACWGGATVRLLGFSGKGGAPSWSRDLLHAHQPYLLGLHLDGDGRGDLLTISWTWGGTVLTALSGANGAMLWDTGVAGDAWPQAAGDADGDGGNDLIVISWELFGFASADGGSGTPVSTAAPHGALDIPALPGHETVGAADHCPYGHGGYGYGCEPDPCYGYGCSYEDPCPGYGYGGGGGPGYGYGYGSFCFITSVTLLEGSTGDEVWYRQGDWLEVAGDATGDGVADVVEEGFVFVEAEPSGEEGEVGEEEGEGSQEEASDEGEWVLMGTLISGADGSDVWREPVPGDYLFPVSADLDGDGNADLVALEFASNDRYLAIAGPNGAALWDAPAEADGWLWVLAPARRPGGGADLFETVYANGAMSTASRSGIDGTVRWRRA